MDISMALMHKPRKSKARSDKMETSHPRDAITHCIIVRAFRHIAAPDVRHGDSFKVCRRRCGKYLEAITEHQHNIRALALELMSRVEEGRIIGVSPNRKEIHLEIGIGPERLFRAVQDAKVCT